MEREKTDDANGIDERSFRLGGLSVEPARNLIKNHTQSYSIEPMIMDVLCQLASHSKHVVTRNDLIKDIWGVQYGSDGKIADAVSQQCPAAILENDGVLVTGSTVLDVFDRLEVLESTAEAVINAKAIGDISVMPESVIEELCTAFDLN